MLKHLIIATLAAGAGAPALAGPPERVDRIDRRLDRAERLGFIEQGSRADRVEDRFDWVENRIDRREDQRDLRVDLGPRDRIEDRIDRAENVYDRREDRRDRLRRGG